MQGFPWVGETTAQVPQFQNQNILLGHSLASNPLVFSTLATTLELSRVGWKDWRRERRRGIRRSSVWLICMRSHCLKTRRCSEQMFGLWLPLCLPVASLHPSASCSNNRQFRNMPNSAGFLPVLPQFQGLAPWHSTRKKLQSCVRSLWVSSYTPSFRLQIFFCIKQPEFLSERIIFKICR